MNLNGVMRARMMLITNEMSMIMGVSKPSTVCTPATRELSSGTTPLMPKAALNIVLNGVRAPLITVEPALRTRKPSMVLNVPMTTVEGEFFIATKPMRATRPMTMAGVLRKLTRKSTMVFPPCYCSRYGRI